MRKLKKTFSSAFSIVIYFFKARKLYSHSKKYMKVAHRGAAGYCPENTFASFDRALEMGADYLEIDVQLSKDGEIVVIHDPLVDRTTNGKGRVASYTFNELHKLDAGSWFSTEFADERIPAFNEE